MEGGSRTPARSLPSRRTNRSAPAEGASSPALIADPPSRPLTAAPWLLLAGDVLDTARALRCGSHDLVYADPPFFTRRRHVAAAADAGTGASAAPAPAMGFDDQWAGGFDAYLGWLRPRLAALRDLLAPTGSLFVHLDGHAVHAVKLELDLLFGRGQFINEIIWAYRTGGVSPRRLARKHDSILFYARTPAYKFRPLRERSRLAHRYGFANAAVAVDAEGPYRLTRMRDVWEIPALRGNMRERVPFPTQKPLALLDRIVALVTDPGDLVGDLFCGSGTTLVAAVAAGRRAAGGDDSPAALRLTARRLREVSACLHAQP